MGDMNNLAAERVMKVFIAPPTEMLSVLTLGEGLLKFLQVAHPAEQVLVFIIAAIVHHFEFFTSLDVLVELSLRRRVLTILEVYHVEDIRPGALLAVNALRLAIAGASVDAR